MTVAVAAVDVAAEATEQVVVDTEEAVEGTGAVEGTVVATEAIVAETGDTEGAGAAMVAEVTAETVEVVAAMVGGEEEEAQGGGEEAAAVDPFENPSGDVAKWTMGALKAKLESRDRKSVV